MEPCIFRKLSGFESSGILIKNQFPVILPLIVFEKVDVLIISLNFEIGRPFSVPSIDDFRHLVKKHSVDYLAEQVYLEPQPIELLELKDNQEDSPDAAQG